MFDLKPVDGKRFLSETRRNAFVIAIIFIVIAMALSQGAVAAFGSPDASNFGWNLGGVLVGVVVTYLLVHRVFWTQDWMQMTVYSWNLKRSMMSVTNVMHNLRLKVAANDVAALKLMRFYHLGLIQMHTLENNEGDLLQFRAEIADVEQRLNELGIPLEQNHFELAAVMPFKD